ncbi:MAG TPA: thiamine pyrophosphate-dependent enzyme [Candidatus Limnocylindria bacterium]
MTLELTQCLIRTSEEPHDIADYQTGVPRWCVGCGDNAILTAMQRLCRDNDLAPERTLFMSGIGCSSRLPHYMNTYGFHGTHGRALPFAEGVKMSRPDLDVFVSTGDGDCLSIGAAHWIHALRYNMDLTVILHDNRIYGLTKKQASPTSPIGTKSNTTPKGSYLDALNPLTVSLGVSNVSFVAQVVDWIPEVVYQVISAGYKHKGLSFIRVLQRCPEFMPGYFDPWMSDPQKTQLLRHPAFITPSAEISRTYRNQLEHDPRDLDAARRIASIEDPIPVGILYQNDDVPCYEDTRHASEVRTPAQIRRGLEGELDKFTIWPEGDARA